MASRFINLFKKTDPDEVRAFQVRVLDILAKQFPGRKFSAHDDPHLINCDGHANRMGLTNLHANFLLGDQTDEMLEQLLTEHFSRVLDESVAVEFDDLATVRTSLMPQIMPEAFLRQLDLVDYPIGNELVLGFVIDGDEAYRYVTVSEIKRWGTDPDELREIALSNLLERSNEIEMGVYGDANKLFVINTMDGFDAARIMIPEMRSVIGEHLGSPYSVGIPNRDFLICWSKSDDAAFHEQMLSQISSDFDERPYPLSRHPFFVNEQNEMQFIAPITNDPRHQAADMN